MHTIQNISSMLLCDLIQLIMPLAGLRSSKDTEKWIHSCIHSALSGYPTSPLESVPMSELAGSKEIGTLGFGVLAT